METSNKSLVEIFFEMLKLQELKGVIEFEFYDLYTRFFTILSTDTLDASLSEAYVDRKTNYWFAAFHKSIRQGDFFSDCYILHLTISADNKGVLYNTMLRTFNEYEFQKKLKKKTKAVV